MSDDVLVKVDNVSKRFCRSLKRSLWYGLQDLGSEIGGRRHGGGSGLPQSSADVQLRPDEFWAVKDVSFELRRGECLGLIGRNGAGKTTLLRMLNGLIKPDSGSIKMFGDTGSIIALGAGFNPTLTGRENIRVAASILGLSEQSTKEVIEEVIEFSELNEFIDTPVQSYSSGMQVRLGFAVTTALKPDILILDEVLAVGDVAFRTKCFNHMLTRLHDCACIFVSHNMPQISRISNKVGYMKTGALQLWTTDIHLGIHKYHKDTETAVSSTITNSNQNQILELTLKDQNYFNFIKSLKPNEKEVKISTQYNRQSSDMAIIVKFTSETGAQVCPMIVFSDQEMTNVLQLSPTPMSNPEPNKKNFFIVPFDSSILSGGFYWISVALICSTTGSITANHRYALKFVSSQSPSYAPISF